MFDVRRGRRGAYVVRVGVWGPGAWAGGGSSQSKPHGTAQSSRVILRLWLGKTGGGESVPRMKCIPPPISFALVVGTWAKNSGLGGRE